MENRCKQCGLCCKLIPVDIETNSMLRDGIQPLNEDFAEFLLPLTKEEAININEFYVYRVLETFPNAMFFRCKYLSPANLCSKLVIPQICEHFPSHPLALVDEDCGYNGELFIKSEELKQKIRRYKEEIIYYETQLNGKEEKGYRKIIASLSRFIDKYSVYGADNW